LPSSKRLRITLIRSLIGLKPNHVRTLQALGLRRIRASVVHDDTPAIRGMIDRVPYAVRVEEGSDVAQRPKAVPNDPAGRSRRDQMDIEESDVAQRPKAVSDDPAGRSRRAQMGEASS
jgi:large subunit ribosomal protein L30